jgi:hypothetical protein
VSPIAQRGLVPGDAGRARGGRHSCAKANIHRDDDPLSSAPMVLAAVVVNAILVGCLVVWVAREK